jgi:hypothetical protein
MPASASAWKPRFAALKDVKRTDRTLKVRIGGRRFQAKWAAEEIRDNARKRNGIRSARSRPSLLHPGERILTVKGDTARLDGIQSRLRDDIERFNTIHAPD